MIWKFKLWSAARRFRGGVHVEPPRGMPFTKTCGRAVRFTKSHNNVSRCGRDSEVTIGMYDKIPFRTAAWIGSSDHRTWSPSRQKPPVIGTPYAAIERGIKIMMGER